MSGSGRVSGYTLEEFRELLDRFDDEAREILARGDVLTVETLGADMQEMLTRTASLRDALDRGDLLDVAVFALHAGITNGIGQAAPRRYHKRRVAQERARRANEAGAAQRRDTIDLDKLKEDFSTLLRQGWSGTRAAKHLEHGVGYSYKTILRWMR